VHPLLGKDRFRGADNEKGLFETGALADLDPVVTQRSVFRDRNLQSAQDGPRTVFPIQNGLYRQPVESGHGDRFAAHHHQRFGDETWRCRSRRAERAQDRYRNLWFGLMRASPKVVIDRQNAMLFEQLRSDFDVR
jgi:hypothetical protein